MEDKYAFRAKVQKLSVNTSDEWMLLNKLRAQKGLVFSSCSSIKWPLKFFNGTKTSYFSK